MTAAIANPFTVARTTPTVTTNANLARALEIISAYAEPLSAAEIGFQIFILDAGVDPTSVTLKDQRVARAHNILQSLLRQGKVFARIETREERTIRAGGVKATAKGGQLYSTYNPVPPRRTTTLIPGCPLIKSVMDADRAAQLHASAQLNGEQVHEQIRGEVMTFLAEARKMYSGSQIAKKLKRGDTTVMTILRELEDAGIAFSTPGDKHSGLFWCRADAPFFADREARYRKQLISAVRRLGPISATDLLLEVQNQGTTMRKVRNELVADGTFEVDRTGMGHLYTIRGSRQRRQKDTAPPVRAFQPAATVPTVDAPEGPDVLEAIRRLVAPAPVPDTALIAENARLRAEIEDLQSQLRAIRTALGLPEGG